MLKIEEKFVTCLLLKKFSEMTKCLLQSINNTRLEFDLVQCGMFSNFGCKRISLFTLCFLSLQFDSCALGFGLKQHNFFTYDITMNEKFSLPNIKNWHFSIYSFSYTSYTQHNQNFLTLSASICSYMRLFT